jgi:hypothetical protein
LNPATIGGQRATAWPMRPGRRCDGSQEPDHGRRTATDEPQPGDEPGLARPSLYRVRNCTRCGLRFSAPIRRGRPFSLCPFDRRRPRFGPGIAKNRGGLGITTRSLQS